MAPENKKPFRGKKEQKQEPEPTPPEEYVARIANNLTETKQLIAQGYEYATDIYGKKLFRKHK